MSEEIKKQTQEKQPEYSPALRVPKTKLASHPTPAGDHIAYSSDYYVEDGDQKAKPGQKIDWFGYIQASRDSCDLSTIVARYLSGDSSVINVNNPIYGDVASMPRNINEVEDLAARVKAGYDNFSDEIKGVFNNNFEEFYNAVLSNKVEAKLNAYASAKEAAAKKAAQEAAAAAKSVKEGE